MKNNKSIYTLTAIHPLIHRDGRKGHYLRDEDNCFKCYNELIGVFSSIIEAQKTIKILVNEKNLENKSYDGWETYVGFIVKEHYVDSPLYDNNVSHFESYWTYLNNGEFNCASECDDRCEKKFKGTKYPNTHIKKSDIALEYRGDILMPVLVEETSMTTKEWKKRMKQGTYGDYTDDSGLSFSAFNGHCHPFAPELFPLSCLPYANILNGDIKKMKKLRKDYFDGVAL